MSKGFSGNRRYEVAILKEVGSQYIKSHVLYYPLMVVIILLVSYASTAEGG